MPKTTKQARSQARQCFIWPTFITSLKNFKQALIIEAFEANGKNQLIKDGKGNYFMLQDLIGVLLKETWTPNLSRNLKSIIPRFKDVGDKSAHSRTFNAVRRDIDDIKIDLRTISEELLYLAKLKM